MKAVNVDDVLKILHKYGKYIFVTDEKKYSDMVDEISNLKALEQEPILDKLRAEIEKAVWEDVVSLDGTDEVRIPRLDPDDVFEILDKYRAEIEPQESEVKDGNDG